MIQFRLPAILLLLLFTVTGYSQHQSNKGYPTELTVAADGSGDFKTISEAIQTFRAYSPVPLTLHIKKGIYTEKVLLPHWLCNLTITGEDATQTIISYDDYSGKAIPAALQDIYHKQTFSTFDSYTLAIYGNDIRLRNLTIRNTAGRVGQAVALHLEGDRISVSGCILSGNQDTLFTGNDTSRHYFSNCFIEGTTDFIFGPATVVFQACEIRSRSESYITAASTGQAQPYGYVFRACRLTADSGVNKVYLGRPWRRYARTVFMESQLGAHIRPEGWHNWNDTGNEATTFYAEYKNNGPGAATQARVSWSKVLKPTTAAGYTDADILRGWLPTP